MARADLTDLKVLESGAFRPSHRSRRARACKSRPPPTSFYEQAFSGVVGRKNENLDLFRDFDNEFA